MNTVLQVVISGKFTDLFHLGVQEDWLPCSMLTGICRKTALQYVDRHMQEDCLAVCWQAYAGRLPCIMLTGICRKTALQCVDRHIHFMDTSLFDGLLCHHPPSTLVPVPKVCKYGIFWLPAPTCVYLLQVGWQACCVRGGDRRHGCGEEDWVVRFPIRNALQENRHCQLWTAVIVDVSDVHFMVYMQMPSICGGFHSSFIYCILSLPWCLQHKQTY